MKIIIKVTLEKKYELFKNLETKNMFTHYKET